MGPEGAQKFLISELTVNEPGNRGRGILSIILSIIVLLLISSMIVAAIVIINPDIANFTSKQNKVREAITLEEVLQGELSPRDFSSHWLPGDRANNIADQLLYEDSKSLNLVTLPFVLKPQIDIISSQTENGQTPLPSAPPPQPTTGGAPESAEQFNFQHQNTFRPNISVLVSNSSLLSSIDYQGFKLSPSKRYMLIWTAKKKQFRHSSTAKYFLYDIKLDLISLISTKPADELATGSYSDQTVRAQPSHNRYENLDTASLYLSDPSSNTNDDSYARFQIVDWFSVKSDQNTNDQSIDSLVLIQNNDIYTLNNVAELSSSAAAEINSNSDLARPSTPIRLTFTGKAGEIFNGISDWLYEEEILSDSVAFKVSPSAKYLAYMSFNDSQVNLMPFSTYGDRIIPRVQQIRYPKAGQPNPLVNVHVIENFGSISSQNVLNSALKDVKLELPANLKGRQHYINRINWLSKEKLSLTWSNRNQNESFVIICSKYNNSPSDEWHCAENLHIQSKDGWLDIGDNTHPLDNDHYLALLPKYEGIDVGYFTHLAKVSMNKTNNFVYLTGGRKDVTSINGIDHNNSLIYYTSTVVDEPGQRQMFVANFDRPAAKQLFQRTQPVGTSLEVEPTIASACLTCNHHPGSCLYNHVKLSPSTKYYIFQCEGPDVPRFELHTTMKRQSHGSVVVDTTNSTPFATKSISMPDGRAKYEQLGQTATPRQVENNSLLWVIEDNIDLRNKLEYGKAMPLTVRLKVPIQNTTHFANVLLLLPPPMGPTTTFRATSSLAAAQGRSNIGPPVHIARPRRDINGQLPQAQALPPVLVNRGVQGQRRENLFAHLDMEAIKEYTSQLPNGQQYPMVVDVYGGPGSQKVDYGYSVYFGHYMASNRRTVYAMIDGRGSGFQGSKRLYELYHKFGTVEIQDQIDTTAYLTRVLPFVDPTKVAIWGWSYGGYAAAMALAQSNARALEAIRAHISSLKGQRDLLATTSSPLEPSAGHSAAHLASKAEAIAARSRISSSPSPSIGPAFRGVFECAASVAPVTNWIYYDTAYTEKFMSSPWVNEQYDEHITRDHLISRSSASLIPLSQQQQNLIAANRWTHLNSSAINSLNDSVRRSSPSSQLLELIAKSAQIAASTNSTIQRVVSDLIQNSAGQLHSPFYDELNERYKKASLLDQIGNIDRKRFLLIHGTADDNVHFQNSIMLMKQLIKKNILFESRLYPDQDHGIANKAEKLHLATTLTNFFAECFDMAY